MIENLIIFQQNQNKVADLDAVDMKSSGAIPGLFVYEFDLPQELCGRLIGKQGKHVKSIKERTNANVFIKRHPFDSNLKTVVVEGIKSLSFIYIYGLILSVEYIFTTLFLYVKMYINFLLYVFKMLILPLLLFDIILSKIFGIVILTLKSTRHLIMPKFKQLFLIAFFNFLPVPFSKVLYNLVTDYRPFSIRTLL